MNENYIKVSRISLNIKDTLQRNDSPTKYSSVLVTYCKHSNTVVRD